MIRRQSVEDQVQQLPPANATLEDPYSSSSDDDSLKDGVEKVDLERLADPTTIQSIPDGGYGWVNVVAIFFISANTWGVNGSYGVYLAHYYAENVFPGASQLLYAFAAGLGVAMMTFPSPLVVFVNRKIGPSITAMIGAIIEAAGYIVASFSTQISHIFIAQLTFGLGCCFSYVGTYPVISLWFHKRRTLATAIGAAGGGFGGIVWSIAASTMIKNMGIDWAFRITGIVLLVVNLACGAAIKDRKTECEEKIHQKGFDHRLLRLPETLLLIGWMVFCMFAYTIILFAVPDYAISIGFTREQANLTAVAINVGMTVGRPLIGYLSDRCGRINIACGSSIVGGMICFLWLSTSSYASLVAFSIFAGLTVTATPWATIGPLAAEVLGIGQQQSVLSLIWTFVSVPTCFAAPISLALESNSWGGYFDVHIFSGTVMMIAASILLTLRARMITKRAGAQENASFSSQKNVLPNLEEGKGESITKRVQNALKWEKI